MNASLPSSDVTDTFTGLEMPEYVIDGTHPVIIRANAPDLSRRIRCTPARLERLHEQGRVLAFGPLGGSSITSESPVNAEDTGHERLKRCDASPFGAPCICPHAPHELRFLGENVTMNRMQWETLREQMHDHAPDARRIDDMLSEPRHWRGVSIVETPASTGVLPDDGIDAGVSGISPAQHVAALSMPFRPDRRS